ncbi:hypothetical protein QYE76_040263 [Lolium multiflorum]|uniref:Secreted protein n=1 Tax=Lolium multiflorum TaxID=4521 RepID=A0AAD8TAV5_LOLMU|nr:hypothetical protein QYE76_040263 [Lolium multiflorum]
MREDSTPAYQLGGPAAVFLPALLLSALAARARARSASSGIMVRFPLNSRSCVAFQSVPCLEASVPGLLIPLLAKLALFPA